MYVAPRLSRGREGRQSHPGSVADLLDRWLDDITATRSAYTVRQHRLTIDMDIKPVLCAIGVDKLAPESLIAYTWVFRPI